MEESRRSAENFATRPLVLNPLARVQRLAPEGKEFLLGENIANSLIWTMPRAVVDDKSDYPVQEDLLYRNFPIGNDDLAESPYLGGYIDFGWLGLFVYPVLLAFLWYLALLLMNYPGLLPLCSLFYAAVFLPIFALEIGESSLITWFSVTRNSLFLLPVFVLISKRSALLR